MARKQLGTAPSNAADTATKGYVDSASTTGSAATLTTPRTIQTNLNSTTAASFNGSANITPGVTGTLPVNSGGTGATTLTGVLKGNGTSAFTAATAGTDYVAPGGALGTPSSATLTNATGLPVTGISATGTPGATTYLRGDGTWAASAGDVSSNTATSVDSEVAVFSGTGGKTLKRATGSGLAKLTSGVLSTAIAGTDFVAPGGALGTPSSATLTNATGLPVSGLVGSTTTALGLGSVELGHASDTTLTRSAAGTVAVEGVDLVKTNDSRLTAAVAGSQNGTPAALTLWTGTKAQFDAIVSKSSTTVYVVTP